MTGLLLMALSCLSMPDAAAQSPEPSLRLVAIDAQSEGEVQRLFRMGLDIAAVQQVPGQTYQVHAVVSSAHEAALAAEGFGWQEIRGKGPVRKIGDPYDVYRSFDHPGEGIESQLRGIASGYSQIAQLKTIGRSIERRPLLAMRLTNEKTGKKADRPQVLFLATQHARDWVATEMAMRWIKFLAANYGSDARVTNLLDTVEVWVVAVVNPDGYQYTFTNERYWRKNLRDNDGDGEITLADGVDINRNFAHRWGLDDEGSSPVWQSAVYRGIAPESEPETQAVADFVREHDFKFAVSYQAYGNLLLSPWAWQVRTPSLDDPVFVAQAGTDANPAVWDSLVDEGYDTGVWANLYTANGELADWAYGEMGVPTHTVVLTSGQDPDGSLYGFLFPDDEGLLQTVFEDNLEFALSLAESAVDPAHPVSPVGITADDIYHTPVTDSYGPDQIIEVLAREGLDLSLSYSINAGPAQTAGFSEKLGQFYNDRPGVLYSKYQAIISGQGAGDNVSYEIGGDASAGPYGYAVTSSTGNPILVVAAEDYSGLYPVYTDPTQPNYLQYYTDALDAGGFAYDVWDVDVRGIPGYAEVLSHYEVVIWYTGDDYAATEPLELDTQEAEVLNFRDFLNHGGKLFASGQDLGWLSAIYGYYPDDFFQYYLGASIELDTAGVDPGTSLPFDVAGVSVLDGLSFGLQGSGGADNQCCSSSFLVTSYFLPHHDSAVAARYVRPGGASEPHSGDYYVYSHMTNFSFERLGGTFLLPAGTPSLRFWTSYDIEDDWDYAFVEINELGTDGWTTLPDINGLTTTGTGESCTSGWVDEIHPFLAHYMDADCNPTGSTGAWHALTGNSGGWQQVEVDLSPWAGRIVELYISYATDWATPGVGVFVDDIELSGYPLEDFEAGSGDWRASMGPDSVAWRNWARISVSAYPEAPAIRTPYSVYLGFGFEAIDNATDRQELMDRVMTYLGQ